MGQALSFAVLMWKGHCVMHFGGDADGQFALALDYRRALPDLTASFVAFRVRNPADTGNTIVDQEAHSCLWEW